MTWSNRYIGIPQLDHGRDRRGADCWGLACLICREELGITLPDNLGYGSVAEHAEIAALLEAGKTDPHWDSITDPRPFDIAVFRRGPFETHVGIVVQPGLMIHMAGGSAVLETYRQGRWLQRLTGHWRYRSTPFETPLNGGVQ